MSEKYYRQQDGEWVHPAARNYRIACCDCGLCHKISIRIKNGKVQFRAWRDNRATSARRRNPQHAALARFLKKFDAVQKRTAKGKGLQFD